MKYISLITLVFLSISLTACCPKTDISQDIIATKAIMKIYPDNLDEFKIIIKSVVENTLKEKGCLNYCFYQDASDPTVFFLYEEFIDEKAWDIHLKQDFLADFRKQREHMIDGDIPYTIFKAKTIKEVKISPKSLRLNIDI